MAIMFYENLSVIRNNRESVRTIAQAAKEVLEYSDEWLSHPFNYTCVVLPKHITRPYSVFVLQALQREYQQTILGVEDTNSAFLNIYVERTYEPTEGLLRPYNTLKQHAYCLERRRWLHYLVNMGELYA